MSNVSSLMRMRGAIHGRDTCCNSFFFFHLVAVTDQGFSVNVRREYLFIPLQEERVSERGRVGEVQCSAERVVWQVCEAGRRCDSAGAGEGEVQ